MIAGFCKPRADDNGDVVQPPVEVEHLLRQFFSQRWNISIVHMRDDVHLAGEHVPLFAQPHL